MTQREIDFVAEVEAIVNYLAEKWFPHTKLSPGGLSYACDQCDMHCSTGDHDEDCLYRIGQETKAILESIDRDDTYKVNMFGIARNDVAEVRNEAKLRHIMGRFYPTVMKHFPPLDYSDPANERVCCSCSILGAERKHHHADCPIIRLAVSLKGVLRT